MAYLNTTSTGFFLEDLNASPPRFKLYRNQGVANYIDYEVFGVFSGRGALRFENFVYPSTPQRIFRIFASSVFPPLQISDSALKLTPPDGWSGKEVRVKVLVKGETGADGYVFIDLGGSSTNQTIFAIGRQDNQMVSAIYIYTFGFPSNVTTPISFSLNSWYLVDFQAKLIFSTEQLILKNVVYPVNLNADGTFNSLGTPVGVQTANFGPFPSSATLWGVNPIEVQGISGNPVGIWFDNLSVGQGEGITEL
ncbi:MAG: hypothetical protein ACO2PO_01405 [Candidatus Calescibacterium sp.]